MYKAFYHLLFIDIISNIIIITMALAFHSMHLFNSIMTLGSTKS